VSLDALNEGVKPGHSNVYGSLGASSDYSQTSYNADMKKFRQIALSSQEFPVSDCEGTSSNDSRDMGTKSPTPPK